MLTSNELEILNQAIGFENAVCLTNISASSDQECADPQSETEDFEQASELEPRQMSEQPEAKDVEETISSASVAEPEHEYEHKQEPAESEPEITSDLEFPITTEPATIVESSIETEAEETVSPEPEVVAEQTRRTDCTRSLCHSRCDSTGTVESRGNVRGGRNRSADQSIDS